MFMPSGASARWLTLGLALGALVWMPSPALAVPAVSDLNDDGVVNVLDLYIIIGLLGTRAGEANYREGIDLVPDGIIDLNDYRALLPDFGAAAPVEPTMLRGRVFDGLGNPLPGVLVQLGAIPVEGVTDPSGNYAISIPPGETGETVVTFDGSSAVDPTPGSGSGEYPTIPNKPIFINGGTENVFRDIALPERNLSGSLELDSSNATITTNPDGSHTAELLVDVVVANAGIKLHVPAGCTATFPAGEDTVLSIALIDPSRLPVPMPPGLLGPFVDSAPGDTRITCPAGLDVITEVDNPGFPAGDFPLLFEFSEDLGVFVVQPSDCNVSPDLTKVLCRMLLPLVLH